MAQKPTQICTGHHRSSCQLTAFAHQAHHPCPPCSRSLLEKGSTYRIIGTANCEHVFHFGNFKPSSLYVKITPGKKEELCPVFSITVSQSNRAMQNARKIARGSRCLTLPVALMLVFDSPHCATAYQRVTIPCLGVHQWIRYMKPYWGPISQMFDNETSP